VSRNQKDKTSLDFTEARDSEWQWHQLGHMQVCTSLQADNHASTPPLTPPLSCYNKSKNIGITLKPAYSLLNKKILNARLQMLHNVISYVNILSLLTTDDSLSALNSLQAKKLTSAVHMMKKF